MEPLLLRAAEVAKLLGLGRSKVFAMLAAGELPVVRIGRSVRVPRAALEHWIVEHTQHACRSEDAGPLFGALRIGMAPLVPALTRLREMFAKSRSWAYAGVAQSVVLSVVLRDDAL